MSALRRLLPILILATVPLAAQTTGSISGHVNDTSGATLPGVTVEATSPALQGTRVAISDINGLKQTPTITVYGSSGAENAFYVDGVNTTNSEYGFQGKELNFEFIEAGSEDCALARSSG